MKTNDEKLATKWGCDPRTIRRWRKAGAPLRDPKRLRVWLAGQHSLPAGTASLLAQVRATETAKGAQVQSKQLRGMVAALRRLEEMEARAFDQFNEALATGDAVQIKAARENWLKISESLRRTDVAIEQSRRDSGELVPREQAERLACELQRASYFAALALESIVPSLVGLKDAHQVWAVLGRVKDTMRASVVSFLQRARSPEAKIPDWLVKAVTMGAHPVKPEEAAQQYAEFWAALVPVMKAVAEDAKEKLAKRLELGERHQKATAPEERLRIRAELQALES